MATPKRFAIRDCGEATFFSLTTLKPIVTLSTLKTSGVETSGETKYSRGGLGNAKLVGFSSNREAKITLEDAIFDNKAIAMLTGNDPTTAAVVIDYNESKASLSDAVTLTKTPVGDPLGVFLVNADGTNGTEYTKGDPANASEYSISGKVITVPAATADSTLFRVYYKVTTDATANTIKVTSDQFGKSFRVILDVVVRDEYTKADYAGQIRIPNAKFEDNFKMDFSADGDPATLSLPLEILKSTTTTDMWQLVIYDEALIVAT